MKIPNFARLVNEDFEDLEWFPQLAYILNRPLETLTKALQGKLTFEDNFHCVVREVRLDGSFPIVLPFNKGLAKHVLVTNVLEGTITGAPFLQWEANGLDIAITGIVGATPTGASPIKLSIIIIAGV